MNTNLPEFTWAPVPVGKLDPTTHQIALRGPLIALATNGSDDEDDGAAPGVFVVDGHHGKVRFFAPVPKGSKTLGVALDADALVFAVNQTDASVSPSAGGDGRTSAAVVRLGLDGGYDWATELAAINEFLPPDSRGEVLVVAPPALLKTSDGAADVSVLFSVRINPRSDELFAARLDGTTGTLLNMVALPSCQLPARQYLLPREGGFETLVWCGGNAPNVMLLDGTGGSPTALASTRFYSPPWLGGWQADASSPLTTTLVGTGENGIVTRSLERLASEAEEAPVVEDKVSPALSALVDLPVGAPCLLREEPGTISCVSLRAGEDDAPVFSLSSTAGKKEKVSAFASSLVGDADNEPAHTVWALDSSGTLARVTFPSFDPPAVKSPCRGRSSICIEEAATLGPIDTASLGDVNEDGLWDLVTVTGGKLTAVAISARGRALSRYPFGDERCTGLAPNRYQTPTDYGLAARPMDRQSPDLSELRVDEAFEFDAEKLRDVSLDPAPMLEPYAAEGSAGAALPQQNADVLDNDLGWADVLFASGGGPWVAAPGSHPILDAAGTGLNIYEAEKDGGRLVGWSMKGTLIGPVRSWTHTADQALYATRGLVVQCKLNQSTAVEGACTDVVSGDWIEPIIAISGGVLWIAERSGGVRAYEPGGRALDKSRWLPSNSERGSVRALRAAHDALAVVHESGALLYLEGAADAPRTTNVPMDELVACGERWFALSDGVLLEASSDFQFTRVTDQPKAIRTLRCGTDGQLVGVALHRGAFVVVAPSAWPSRNGLLLAAALLSTALLFLIGARLTGRRRAKPTDEDEVPGRASSATTSVKRFFDVDVPHGDIRTATARQKTLVRSLKAFLDNESTEPPLTLGVYGPWGSGKSSIMEMLRSELEGTRRYVTVWFNAWRHRSEDHLGPALLQNVVQRFRHEAGPVVRFNVWWSSLHAHRSIGNWLLASLAFLIATATAVLIGEARTSVLTGLVSLGTLYKGSIEPFSRLFSIEPVQATERSAKKRIAFLQEFSQEFERVISALPRNHFVAVFVDDLDRCPPDRVVDVLETLNRLMESRRCYVILGMDAATVKHCINLRYKDLIEELNPEREFGEMFLEKLVTIAVHVPPVEPKEIRERLEPQRQRLRDRLLDGTLRRFDQVVIAAALLFFGFGGLVWNTVHPEAVASGLGTVRTLWESAEAPPSGATRVSPPDTSSAAEATVSVDTTELPAPTTSPPTKAQPTTAYSSKGSPPKPLGLDGKKVEHLGNPRILEAPPARQPVLASTLAVDASPMTLAERQGLARSRSQGILLVVLLVCFLVLMFVLLYVTHEAQKLLKEPPAKDSDEFSDLLDATVAELTTNPRALVRFKNLARLSYYMVNASQAHDASPGWLPQFFKKLESVFRAEPYQVPAPHDWVDDELERWLSGVASETPDVQARGPRHSGIETSSSNTKDATGRGS